MRTKILPPVETEVHLLRDLDMTGNDSTTPHLVGEQRSNQTPLLVGRPLCRLVAEALQDSDPPVRNLPSLPVLSGYGRESIDPRVVCATAPPRSTALIASPNLGEMGDVLSCGGA